MMRRLARPFAISAVAVAVIGAIGGLTIRAIDPVPVIPDTLGFTDAAQVAFAFLGVTFAAVGALLVVRRPENAVGWLMMLIGCSNALAGLTAAVTFSAVADGPPGAAAAGVAGWLTVLFTMTGTLVFGLGFIFPTGHGHTPGLGSIHPGRRGRFAHRASRVLPHQTRSPPGIRDNREPIRDRAGHATDLWTADLGGPGGLGSR